MGGSSVRASPYRRGLRQDARTIPSSAIEAFGWLACDTRDGQLIPEGRRSGSQMLPWASKRRATLAQRSAADSLVMKCHGGVNCRVWRQGATLRQTLQTQVAAGNSLSQDQAVTLAIPSVQHLLATGSGLVESARRWLEAASKPADAKPDLVEVCFMFA